MEQEYVRGLKLCEKGRVSGGPTSENHGSKVGLGKNWDLMELARKPFFGALAPKKAISWNQKNEQ